MSKAQHTPTPWEYYEDAGFNFGIGSDGRHVANISHNANVPTEEKQANAAFIVRAANNHEALVEALEMMLENPFEPRNEYTAPLRFAKARAALKAAQAK